MSDTTSFRALVVSKDGENLSYAIQNLTEADLPPGDTVVDVSYSTLNYKDALVLKNLGRLVKSFPHVPGIDFAGTVRHSESTILTPGQKVILTGWRVGETRFGSYAERARVPAEWLVPLPEGLSLEGAMAVGTAGFTAMLALMALERHGVLPESGDLLVTGAAGGVGSMAVAMAARLGYRVIAATGRTEESDYLRSLGATAIMPRAELIAAAGKPLQSERFAGAVDAVGGGVLAGILPQLRYGGAVAACGLAGGSELHTTVIPFLLRGVSLLGIDSVMQPRAARIAAWERIATTLPAELITRMTRQVTLEDLPRLADEILAGHVRGRIVVDVKKQKGAS